MSTVESAEDGADEGLRSKYEAIIIYSPELGEQQLAKEFEEMRETLGKNGGKVFQEELLGVRRFAYKIKKFSSGYYAVFQFETEPSSIAEVKTFLRLNLAVVRHMILALPERFNVGEQKEAEELLKKELTERSHKSISKRPRMKTKPAVRAQEVVIKRKEETVEEKKVEETAPDQETVKEKKEPLLAGETQEEKLKSVEKTLESILDNPDIKL